MKPAPSKPINNRLLNVEEYDRMRAEALTSTLLLRVLDYHFHGNNNRKSTHFKMDKKCKLEADGIHEDLKLEQGLEKWRERKEAKK